jgi:ABC-type arginine/histidine transport system permease subunit
MNLVDMNGKSMIVMGSWMFIYIFMDTDILMDLFTDFNGTTGVLVPEILYIYK